MSATPHHSVVPRALNLALVVGVLARDPELRNLPNGATILELDVHVRSEGRPLETVPVVLPDPPASTAALAGGIDVVVIGRIRRRFYRAGGSTVSRTEVVAGQVLPARQAKKALAQLEGAVEAALAPPGG